MTARNHSCVKSTDRPHKCQSVFTFRPNLWFGKGFIHPLELWSFDKSFPDTCLNKEGRTLDTDQLSLEIGSTKGEKKMKRDPIHQQTYTYEAGTLALNKNCYFQYIQFYYTHTPSCSATKVCIAQNMGNIFSSELQAACQKLCRH